MSLYSVVVPVYNSEHTLTELYTRLDKVFRETVQEPFELILVDDGSKDRSYQIMEELRQKDPRVKIIQMARNFGQHPALLCGFSHAAVSEPKFLSGPPPKCLEKTRICRSPVFV